LVGNALHFCPRLRLTCRVSQLKLALQVRVWPIQTRAENFQNSLEMESEAGKVFRAPLKPQLINSRRGSV
jgi:hypothetical protein